MVSFAGILQWTALTLAAVLALGAVGGAVAPDLAPGLMTMETMDRALGVDRYEDRGTCDFWVTNMSLPTERIERDFACSFYWDWSKHDNGTAYVHEVLEDLETEQVFHVPNMDRGNMEEWYHVDSHMLTEDALTFTRATGGDAGVLMPPPGARGNVTMGWVTSGGVYGAPEELLVGRQLVERGTQQVEGLEVVRWESSFERELVNWHGYDAYMSEEVEMLSDPRTGWVLEMYRHVLVEMTPGQMSAAFGVTLPVDRDEPEPVMELTYRTVPGAIDGHVAKAKEFRQLMYPIENGEDIRNVSGASAGLLAILGVCTRTTRRVFSLTDA